MIPERALHGDKIYLVSDNNTLNIMPVTVLFRRDGKVAINGDLSAQQQLIVNDLLPAVSGMELQIITRNGKTLTSEQTPQQAPLAVEEPAS